MSVFGEQLKLIRKERRLRQSDLSGALGLAQTTIANYEQGIRFPDEDTLNRLADHLGVSIDYLLGRTDQSRPLALQLENRPARDLDKATLDLVLGLLVDGDFNGLQTWFEQKILSGLSLVELYVGIIQPAMYEVGWRWETGRLDVYREHAISSQIQSHLSLLMTGHQKNPQGPRFLGFAVSGDQHELGIRMISDILQYSGWNSLFLGVNLPVLSMVTAIRDFRPAVIGISATLDQHLSGLQQTIHFLRSELKAICPKIMVGGFSLIHDPARAAALGADAVAVDGLQAVELASALLKL